MNEDPKTPESQPAASPSTASPASPPAPSPAPMSFFEPWQPLLRMRQDLDRLFQDFTSHLRLPLSGLLSEPGPLTGRLDSFLAATAPAVDLTELDKAYELKAELPGMDESNVEMSLADNVLTIRGEKKHEGEHKTGSVVVSERRYGSFQRAFRLPDNVLQDKIEATMKNGVLTVSLPKAPQAAKSEKAIPIKPA